MFVFHKRHHKLTEIRYLTQHSTAQQGAFSRAIIHFDKAEKYSRKRAKAKPYHTICVQFYTYNGILPQHIGREHTTSLYVLTKTKYDWDSDLHSDAMKRKHTNRLRSLISLCVEKIYELAGIEFSRFHEKSAKLVLTWLQSPPNHRTKIIYANLAW